MDDSVKDQFLDNQLLGNPSMYNLISERMDETNNFDCGSTMDDPNYHHQVFESFPSYTSQQYMPEPLSTHRGSLPIIYDTHTFIPNKPKEAVDMNTTRRYTEGSLPKYKRKRKEPVDEQRRQFLERNRVAALKCRQRKKQWLSDLQDRVEYLATDNEQLQTQATMLREEVISLKTLLLAHKDCEVAQSNGITVSVIQNASSMMPPDMCALKRVH